MYHLYRFAIGLLFWLSFPVTLVVVLVTGRHRRGLAERLGCYRFADGQTKSGRRVWIHAASIGELKAAGIIIDHLAATKHDFSFVLTTMTIHGRDYARTRFPQDIQCFLAPLDVPGIVDRVVTRVRPDVYVCLETELWPLLIQKIRRNKVATVLLNGRISDKSIRSYTRFRFLFGPVLKSFDRIGAIGPVDRQRFLLLGADPSRLSVTGNVKHDSGGGDHRHAVIRRYRDLLGLPGDADVFVAGSTHDPEEEQLLPLYRRFGRDHGQIWLLAPRHLSRLPALESMLLREGVAYDRLSACRTGTVRRHGLVLVDTMGDLADLYAIASFVFVGGSLTNYGGHNVMEAAIWDKAVFFGPHTQDFEEETATLETAGAGFRVTCPEDLGRRLAWSLDNRAEFAAACRTAGEIARRKSGAARTQAGLILQALGLVPV